MYLKLTKNPRNYVHKISIYIAKCAYPLFYSVQGLSCPGFVLSRVCRVQGLSVRGLSVQGLSVQGLSVYRATTYSKATTYPLRKKRKKTNFFPKL
jgi:hypothetical protein